MAAAKKTGGLAGVTAGTTHLCTVGKEGAGLTYRGYDIADIVENAGFEEVAYLLLHGKLPNRAQLNAYVARIKANRGLTDELKSVLEMVPADAHPMDVLRTGVSFLGNIEPERDFSNQGNVADRLLACVPSILLYWHRFHTDGQRIDTETDDDSIAGHFLHMLHGKPPKELHRKCLDTTLILYAEHEFNASTFTARVITGTLSDMHSAVTGAIGALRGTLHGGANEAAMELISLYDTPEEAVRGIHEKLANKDKIIGVRPPRLHHFRSAQCHQQEDVQGAGRGCWQHHDVPDFGGHRKGHVGRKGTVCERGFLRRQRVSLHGYPDLPLYPDLRLRAHHGVGRAHRGTARGQQADPAGRGVRRPAAAGVGSYRGS